MRCVFQIRGHLQSRNHQQIALILFLLNNSVSLTNRLSKPNITSTHSTSNRRPFLFQITQNLASP